MALHGEAFSRKRIAVPLSDTRMDSRECASEGQGNPLLAFSRLSALRFGPV